MWVSNHLRPSGRVVLAFCLSLIVIPTVSAGYSVVDLGILAGGNSSQATALNLFGNVVGTANIDAFHMRAVSGSAGGLSNLGTLPGGQNSEALAINDGGQIAGSSEVAVTTANGTTIQTHAILVGGGGSLRDFGTFGGDSGSRAFGVNGAGIIAGESFNANGSSRAVIGFSPNNFMNLGTLGGQNASATAINNNDEVTGWSQVASGIRHAFVYSGGGLTDIGVLPGFGSSQGQAINLLGQVVGFSGTPGSSDAFLYNPGQALIDLGVLPFGISSAAFGINNTGAIVGNVGFSSGPSHAFVVDPTTQTMIDINSLIVGTSNLVVATASGINDRNQIVGTAMVGGQMHAVLLSPRSGENPFSPPTVPEPASLVLLVIGGAGIVGYRRFRFSQRSAPASA